MKHIKSDDPRKRGFTDALKKLSGGTKVTMVKEDSEFVYGDCLAPIYEEGHRKPRYKHLGNLKISKGG